MHVVCSYECTIELTKKRIQKKEKERLTNWKEHIKTKSDWESDLQKVINAIVRKIDRNHLCISSRKRLVGKFDAGHFYSVGSNPTLRFNLFNIYGQTVYSNQHKSGDIHNYRIGLEETFGKEHIDFIDSMPSKYKLLNLTIEDIKESLTEAKKCLKLATNGTCNSDRLEQRQKFNEMIGIYK
jgi:hypothetical protein